MENLSHALPKCANVIELLFRIFTIGLTRAYSLFFNISKAM
jgi:hypothetical protein